MKSSFKILALAFLLQPLLPGASGRARAQAASAPYPAMAPLGRYLMPEASEIALARSAAPPAISTRATVMVLGRKGYTTAVKGSNGFLCIVERSWANSTDNPEFWNPKMRAPLCFNPQAAKSIAPIYLMKTRLVLAGKSRAEIARAIRSGFDKGEFREVGPGAICYMMSKEQYLNDQGGSWHPHVMFYVSGDAAKSWGANLPGSPIIATNDPEERATVFMVLANHWSDGTPDARVASRSAD